MRDHGHQVVFRPELEQPGAEERPDGQVERLP